MVTYDIIRELARRFPGVEEGTSYGTGALKVKGKLLVRLKEDGETIVLRTDARNQSPSARAGRDNQSKSINYKRSRPTDPLDPLPSAMSLLIFLMLAGVVASHAKINKDQQRSTDLFRMVADSNGPVG